MSSSGVASWGALAISVVCGFLLQKCSSVRALNSACRWCVVRGELVVLVVSLAVVVVVHVAGGIGGLGGALAPLLENQ